MTSEAWRGSRGCQRALRGQGTLGEAAQGQYIGRGPGSEPRQEGQACSETRSETCLGGSKPARLASSCSEPG